MTKRATDWTLFQPRSQGATLGYNNLEFKIASKDVREPYVVAKWNANGELETAVFRGPNALTRAQAYLATL